MRFHWSGIKKGYFYAISKYPDFVLKGNFINVYEVGTNEIRYYFSAGIVECAGLVIESHATSQNLVSCIAKCEKEVPKCRFELPEEYRDFSVFKFNLYKRPRIKLKRKRLNF